MQRCIGKYEKKLARCKQMISNSKWGQYCTTEKAQVPLLEEMIKDLKRFQTYNTTDNGK